MGVMKRPTPGAFPPDLNIWEARTVNRIITAVLGTRFAIMVRDGNDKLMLEATRSRPAIQRVVGVNPPELATLLELIDPVTSERLGCFVLNHGRGRDVIAALHYRPDLPEIGQELERIAAFAEDMP